MTPEFRIEALSPTHNRKSFSSGVDALDRYFSELVSQDVKRRVSHCFVAINDENQIAGYYTFAATSLPITELSAEDAKRLPRYGLLPAALIGRLAIDEKYQGRGLGGALVLDASARAARADVAIYALVVDAKDDVAAAFYDHLQFRRFASRPRTLFLPLATVVQAMGFRTGS